MENLKFYNYMNLEHYCKQMGIEYANSNYIKWIKDIINTKLSMFSYDNLPEGLTSQIIEYALLFNNHLCFYKSKALGFGLYRYIPNGQFNQYWKPTKVNILALNGKPVATNVPFEDIILCRDNTMDIPPFLTLNTHIQEIIEIEKTLDVVVKWLRFPKIIEGEKSEVVTLEKLIKKNVDCEPFVIAGKGFANARFNDIDINIPVQPNQIFELLEKKRNLTLESMGIYAVDNKRERLITEEVASNNDYVNYVYVNMVAERELWIKLLNEQFGYKIKLVESYDKNQADEIEFKREETRAIEEEKAKAQNLIVKDTKVEVEDNE